MSESEETLKQENEILKAIAELSAKVDKRIDDLESKFDSYQKSTDAQFEAIRQGLV